MKFSVGVIIFFLALVALVAEIILYVLFGIGASLAGEGASVSGIAVVFVWLMIMTIAAGLSAPICGFIENITKKPNVGMYIFLPLMGITAIGAGGLLTLTQILTSKSGNQFSFTNTDPKQPGGRWQISEDVSPMDSSKSVTLQLSAENEIKGWIKESRPSLVIRCREGKLEIYSVLGVQANPEYGLYDQYTVRIRFDDQKAISQRWSSSTDHEALFAKNGALLADQISKAKSMLLEFTPFNASPATVRFNVSGLDQHLGKVKAACARRGK